MIKCHLTNAEDSKEHKKRKRFLSSRNYSKALQVVILTDMHQNYYVKILKSHLIQHQFFFALPSKEFFLKNNKCNKLLD